MAGIKSRDLKPEAFASPEKHAELRALLASYEEFLAANKRGDMALVYEEAVKHPDWCPIQPADCWTELPDVVWTPLQRQLDGCDARRANRPRRRWRSRARDPASSSGESTSSASRRAQETAPLAFLLAPASSRRDVGLEAPVAAPATIDLFHAGGKEAEIEEVFRRILASGTSLDQVEIACASPGYDTLIWEKALRLEWPATLGTGLPIECTRPGSRPAGLL